MPDNRLSEAKLAMLLGAKKCGTCKHFVPNEQQPMPAPGQPRIPIQGECRESLQAITTPAPNANAETAAKLVGALTVNELVNILLPQKVTGWYPPTHAAFPACSHHTTPIAEV